MTAKLYGIPGSQNAAIAEAMLRHKGISYTRRDLIPGVHRLLLNKYYVDEIYDDLFVLPVRNGARWLYSLIDRQGIDGVVNFSARFVQAVSQVLSPLESGYVRTYALSIFVGVIVVALVPVVYGTLIK